MILSKENRAEPDAHPFFSEFILVLLQDVSYCLAAVALLFVFLVRMITVSGDSMLPTLQHEDALILMDARWYYRPQPGDIIVARIPWFSQEPVVKRVVALEGDTVSMDERTGAISVNGVVVPGFQLQQASPLDNGLPLEEFPLTVEEGCVFLLGDNRSVSLDSRYALLGQVDRRCIVGKVVFLVLPGRDSNGSRDLGRIGAVE